jgi:hypothetical protein
MGNSNCLNRNNLEYGNEIQSHRSVFESVNQRRISEPNITDFRITPRQQNTILAVRDDLNFYMNNRVKQINSKLGDFTRLPEVSKYRLNTDQPLCFTDESRTDVYKGSYKNGSFHGYGILIKNDGSKFEGMWDMGTLNGFARIISENGDYYQGYVKKGTPHGEGVYRNNKIKYSGEWTNGKMNGKGTEEMIDGSKYTGSFRNGVKNGNGTFIWPDGSYYEGDIKENNFEGTGLYVWSDGRSYDGEWYRNEFSGNGIYTYKDKSVYEGEFIKHKRSGLGRMKYGPDKEYYGFWVNDKQEGLGCYTIGNDVKMGYWFHGGLINRLAADKYKQKWDEEVVKRR